MILDAVYVFWWQFVHCSFDRFYIVMNIYCCRYGLFHFQSILYDWLLSLAHFQFIFFLSLCVKYSGKTIIEYRFSVSSARFYVDLCPWPWLRFNNNNSYNNNDQIKAIASIIFCNEIKMIKFDFCILTGFYDCSHKMCIRFGLQLRMAKQKSTRQFHCILYSCISHELGKRW